MSSKIDCIVLGIGAMGSATCYELAKRGIKVLGIEQFGMAHALGSSHGRLRLTRQAYFEHPNYVPLLKRSYELWKILENEAAQKFFFQTGLLIMGPAPGTFEASKILEGIRASSKIHKIPIEEMTAIECQKRFPTLRPPSDFVGIFEPGAGYLLIEDIIRAFCKLSEKHGATLHFDERVLKWEHTGTSFRVKTTEDTYETPKLVMTAGPWTAPLLAGLKLPLKVKRAPQAWFDADEKMSAKAGMPCFGFDMPYDFIYGFPKIDGAGVKIADHIPKEAVDNPTRLNRKISEADLKNTRACIKECLPYVIAGSVLASSVCMYTMTPDEKFIVDQHPEYQGLSFAAGFSGHGFKFSSVIGEILADFVSKGRTDLPIDFLKRRW